LQPDDTAPAPFTTVLHSAKTPGLVHWLPGGTKVYNLPAALPPPEVSAAPGPAFEWEAATGKLVGDLFGRTQPPAPFGTDSIVNRDGTLAALGDGDKIELWDIGHHSRAAVFDTGQHQPLPTWDPAANILATTGSDGTLALWDTSNLADVKLLARAPVPGHVLPYSPTAHFSPDGRTIAVQNADSNVTALVSVADARTRQVFKAGLFTAADVFSSDAKTLAIAQLPFTGDAQVVLRDVATGQERSTVTVPYPQLNSAAFVNGDRWLVTVQSAQIRGANPDDVTSRVDVWDVSTHQPIGEPIIVRGDAGALEVDQPGGSRLVSGTTAPTAGSYLVWNFDPAKWVSLACGLAGRNLAQAEWKEYLPNRAQYQLTCPQWPAGP
jgi:hypothetical protein